MKKIEELPLAVGAGAVYPYSEELLEECAKVTRYGDDYTIARVVGEANAKRIWLPRNMAPAITKDLRVDGFDYEFESSFVPRNSEQSRVIYEAVGLLEEGENFVLECPTGFGKTICSMDIIAQVGKKTLVVVTKEDLRDQWIEAAERILGLTLKNGIGLIQANKCSTVNKGIVIALIQSLSRENRYPEHIFREFGFAVWDETHRVGADFFSQSCYRVPAKLRMGVSATPDRKDGRSFVIEGHIGPVMVRSEKAPMTPRVIRVTSPWQLPFSKVKKGLKIVTVPLPHSPGKCGHVINMLTKHHGRNMIMINFMLAAYKKGRIILFQSDRLEHIETIQSMLVKAGIPAPHIGHYASGLTSSQLEVIKKKKVIMATYQMTAEGTDIPWADTLVMGTPKSDVAQIVGRVIREHEGKQEPLVLDIVDSTSSVFKGYANSRMQWYASKGATVGEIAKN